MSPNSIVEQLGFRDLRTFSRVFKRWTGLTPAAYARLQNCPGPTSYPKDALQKRGVRVRTSPIDAAFAGLSLALG